ncbi:tRNA-binding protein [Haloglycomyces albus]|uniref:tRNA-binding protein n=1 Tax=Haloglycomyces albus TaxID=526067 RepID=UPI00046D2C11|nr:tRNA-binding protein [Haloglycomyces albus]
MNDTGNQQITFDDFTKIEMRVGRIVKAEPFPKARKPAYKLTIDFGEYGMKNSSAQITKRYALEDLEGRRIIAVMNFPPMRIADFQSEVLVLGAGVDDNSDITLLSPDAEAPLGARVH